MKDYPASMTTLYILLYNNMGVYLWVEKILPVEYQEVEYIQSTGTQFLNLDYIFENESANSIEMYINQQSTTSYIGYIGNGGTTGGWIGTNAGYKFMIHNNNGEAESESGALSLGQDYYIYAQMSNNKGELSYGPLGGPLTKITANTSWIHATSMPSYMFAICGTNYSGTHKSSMKVYWTKIYTGYDKDTLKMNLVPCYRISDGVIGMYDTVGSAFYTNVGSGTFLKGQDI